MTINKTVLIVDDDDLVLESIDLLLSSAEGFQSIRALGAAGARSHLQHAHIDVIVADVILAGTVSGIDVCHDALKRYPDVAVVVITADTEVHLHDIPDRGVFLRKPFGATELMVAIQMALGKVRRDKSGVS
ncbi:DNA-binding NtrC family response regulator [Rhodanobacter sp. TND4EL1]